MSTTLFTPCSLRTLTAPNRIWMAAMCQYSAAPDGDAVGVPTDWHFAHLAARATGGTGLIITEATAVSPEGRITPYDLGIWNDAQVTAFRRITAFLKAQDTVPVIQLAHAGRKASTERTWVDRGRALAPDEAHGWTPVAPSAIPFTSTRTRPDELTVDQIRGIAGQFAEAARRALDAGFQAIEIHGAHGYLIHQFLSPTATTAPTRTAAPSRAGSASRWRSSTPSARSGPRSCRSSSASPRRTGSRRIRRTAARGGRRRTPSGWPRNSRPTAWT